jgi:hypothetical protein
VAAFAVGTVLGAGGAWHWRGQVEARQVVAGAAAPSAWVQRVALAHRVYTAERRQPVEVNLFTTAAEQRAEQEAHLQRRLTRRVDLPVKLFDLGAHGFELVGGRLLPDGPDGVSALLMYERPDGPRVTVTLRRANETVPATFRDVQQDGPGAVLLGRGTGRLRAGRAAAARAAADAGASHLRAAAARGRAALQALMPATPASAAPSCGCDMRTRRTSPPAVWRCLESPACPPRSAPLPSTASSSSRCSVLPRGCRWH